jgi:hypothetical protein
LIRWLKNKTDYHKIKSLKTRHPGESLPASRPIPERKTKMVTWRREGANLTVKTRRLGSDQTSETTLLTRKEMVAEASAGRYRTEQQDTSEAAERTAEK